MRTSSKVFVVLLTVVGACWTHHPNPNMRLGGIIVSLVPILTILVDDLCRAIRDRRDG